MKVILIISLGCLSFICSCNQQKEMPSIHTLPMDSSLVIIMEATQLLSDSCVPWCWQRDFSTKKIANHYTGYVLQNRPDRHILGIHPPIRLDTDSSFYPLIDYACSVESLPIHPKDVQFLASKRAAIQVIDDLRHLSDDQLGYITVSPVTIDQSNSRAVFFYELRGDGHSSLIVCARRRQSGWTIVKRELLSVQ